MSFVEIKTIYCFYFQNGLDFFNQKYFQTPRLTIRNNCACINRDYLPIYIISRNVFWSVNCIENCACADISNFKHKGVEIFLLNPRSECQNLVNEFQADLNI